MKNYIYKIKNINYFKILILLHGILFYNVSIAQTWKQMGEEIIDLPYSGKIYDYSSLSVNSNGNIIAYGYKIEDNNQIQVRRWKESNEFWIPSE